MMQRAPSEDDMDVEVEEEEHESSESKASAKPLRRACDCCRKRKVKCDGTEPCIPCKKASIRCAYLQPPKKKGPKGLRSARVLHALRKIDDRITGASLRQLSPEQQTLNTWSWSGNNASPNRGHYPDPVQAPLGPLYTSQPSVPPDQTYFPPHVPAVTLAVRTPEPTATHGVAQLSQYQNEQVLPTAWQSAPPPAPNIVSPTLPKPSDSSRSRIGPENFLPHVQQFFDHMFPIMPVIDGSIYLDPQTYSNIDAFSSDQYTFLCALCAATIVQMEASVPEQPLSQRPKPRDRMFADEVIRERGTYDYLEQPSTTSVMTSFFMFAYCGNCEEHSKAWFYLQECITFSEILNMDAEDSYAKLERTEAQWRRRLYWLLFITERAYAVQRRKRTRLTASVQLPAVFESEDPQLLNGFVNLANLFSAVDDSFVSAWRGSRRASLCNETWLAETQKQLDAAAMALDDTNETQRLHIAVTREWLHVLAWQMGVSNGLIWGKGEGGMRLDYPIELARKVVEITTNAKAQALDSHGIGMEQKLSDIAGCLADVLRCTAGDNSETFQEGRQYLNILMQQLSSIRGKESGYLKPLLAKTEGLMGYELSLQTLPPPTEPSPDLQGLQGMNAYLNANGGRLSLADSFGMLRSLSMSGNLGLPMLGTSLEDWGQRRPSGRVYDEAETNAMGSWEPNVFPRAV